MVKTEIARGNHFDRVKPGMHEFAYIGGQDRLQKIRKVMEAVEPELKPCPFCGAPAVIDGKFGYTTPGIAVRCFRCRCSTPMRLEGEDLIRRRTWTLEELVQDTAGLWNRRAAG